MKHLLCTITSGLLLFGACAEKDAPAQTPAKPETIQKTSEPALWLVSDADTKVYLFGTVHVLKPEMQWKTPKIERAILGADAVYQEADLSDEVQRELSLVLPSLAFYTNGCNLKCDLDDDIEDEIYMIADNLGLTSAALDTMQPWFAAVAITQMHLVKTGYQTDSGVEPVISELAKNADIPMRYFETAEQQVRFFADLPMDAQADFLEASAKAIKETPAMLDDLVADWAEGDVAAIAALMASDDAMGSDIVVDALLTKRNVTWTQTIDTLLDEEEGTFFVAVGAAHLAGPHSVIEMLKDRGEAVIRQ